MNQQPNISFAALSEELELRCWRMSDGVARDRLAEVAHRLEQLDLLLTLLIEASSAHEAEPSQARSVSALKVKTFAESFYYLAARAVDLLAELYGRQRCTRRSGKWLGVLSVREKLIEHGDKSDGVMPINWKIESPGAVVVLKPHGGGPSRRWFDSGIWLNATELHEQIADVLVATRSRSNDSIGSEIR